MHRAPDSPPSFLIHNGVLIQAGTPAIALTDGALARGQGAFETIAAYRGRPFLLAAHLDRLQRAAERLSLPCPSDQEIGAAIAELLSANQLQEVERTRIRLTLTAPLPAGPSWFVEAGPLPLPREQIRLITIPFTRNERSALAGLKTINYGENVVAMRLAHEAGADEALFGNSRDELCEGTWSNIFLFDHGTFLTPPLSSGCLPGVTRAVVLELGRALGLEMREVVIPLSHLSTVPSAFLTSSLREIQTVSALNGRALVEAAPLAQLREAFAALVARETSPRLG